MRIKWIVKFNLTGGPNNSNFSDPRSDFHLILLMVESYTVVILFIRSANLLIEREFGFSPFQSADLYRIGSTGKQTAVDFCCVSPSRFLSRSLFFSGRTMDRRASRFCRVIIVFSFFPPSRGKIIKTIRILFHLRVSSSFPNRDSLSFKKKN